MQLRCPPPWSLLHRLPACTAISRRFSWVVIEGSSDVWYPGPIGLRWISSSSWTASLVDSGIVVRMASRLKSAIFRDVGDYYEGYITHDTKNATWGIIFVLCSGVTMFRTFDFIHRREKRWPKKTKEKNKWKMRFHQEKSLKNAIKTPRELDNDHGKLSISSKSFNIACRRRDVDS